MCRLGINYLLALVAGMCPQWLPGTYHALVAFSEGRIKSMAMLAGMGKLERSAFTVVPKKKPIQPK